MTNDKIYTINNSLSTTKASVISHESSVVGQKTGFTLLETIIYIALFSLISSFVIAVFYQAISSYDQQRNRMEVDGEANFMMQKMIGALTGAQTVSQPALNATSSAISFNKYNYAQNPVVLDVVLKNIRISEGSGQPVILGSSRIFVDNLVFTHLPAVQSAPEAVVINLSVESSDISRPMASTTLTDTVYLNQ